MPKGPMDWKSFKEMAPASARAVRKLLKDEAEADDPDDPWYESSIEYVGPPPGLDRVLERDTRILEVRPGTFVVELNPAGQVYNPGHSYIRVSDSGRRCDAVDPTTDQLELVRREDGR